GHDYPLADPERRPGSDLDHLAHGLVADDVARHHAGNDPVVEMEVRAADGGRSDPDDRIARVDDLGIGNGFHTDVVGAVPGDCAHGQDPWFAGSRRFLAVAISPVSISILKRLSSWRACT